MQVLTVDDQAGARLERQGGGLVGGLVEHRREAEEVAPRRLIDDHVLVVFVHHRHGDGARNEDIRALARIANPIDALTLRKVG